MEIFRRKNYPKILFFAFLVIWILFAIMPVDRIDWLMENIIVVLFIPILVVTYKKFRLSDFSYSLIFIFLIFHLIGGHFTYGRVPIRWSYFGFERNMYDRIVHFLFGFLISYPIREVVLRITNVKGVWGYYLPFDVTMSFSALYEIGEWLGVLVMSPGQGAIFLGADGDYFDYAKDMLCAGVGSLVMMIVIAIFNWKYDGNFKDKIKASWKVKRKEPLGENRFKKLLDEASD